MVGQIPAAVLLGGNAPRSFIKLFSSQQKFTLPHTAARQFSLNTHISGACVPSQRFTVSRVTDAAWRPSALAPSFSIHVWNADCFSSPVKDPQRGWAKSYDLLQSSFLNCLLCKNPFCCHTIRPLKYWFCRTLALNWNAFTVSGALPVQYTCFYSLLSWLPKIIWSFHSEIVFFVHKFYLMLHLCSMHKE